jgi:sarcosine oxidase
VQRVDAIVIGVGGMGSAAVYHLAKRGAQVLGLERFDIPNAEGSSHGVNRIIRLAYWEDPSYVPLLRRAYELWRELEHTSGERILVITGSVDAGYPGSQTLDGALRSCDLHHLPHELLSASALAERFPGYRLPEDMQALYQPEGGFVLSEAAICAHVAAAQQLGAEVHAREAVQSIRPDGGEYLVLTDRGEYRTERVVLTAGAWLGKFLPDLAPLAVPERQVLLWAQPTRPEHFALGRFPVFNMEGDDGRFYGFPVYGIPGFKIGRYHHLEEAQDPDRVDREIHPTDEEALRSAIRRYFPEADGPTMSMRTCLFTNTPDDHFLLGMHPSLEHFVVAGGFSGHGYKFASVMGEILADLALEGKSPFDLRLFRLDRFSN